MFVAETLAMKAAGLDRDGIDVYFTVDGDAHNLKALVGDGGRQRLRKALLNAAPDNIDHKDSQTNMLEVLLRMAFGRRQTTTCSMTPSSILLRMLLRPQICAQAIAPSVFSSSVLATRAMSDCATSMTSSVKRGTGAEISSTIVHGVPASTRCSKAASMAFMTRATLMSRI
jgi:hypothetical protein